GKTLQTLGAPAPYVGLDLSPDERQLAFHRHEPAGGGDVWLMDLTRGAISRFTFDPAQDNSSPVWSPDGRRIAYASFRNGQWGLFVKDASGSATEQHLADLATSGAPRSWSSDGRHIVYSIAAYSGDVLALALTGDQKPMPLLTSRFAERYPQLSPDGRWLAY